MYATLQDTLAPPCTVRETVYGEGSVSLAGKGFDGSAMVTGKVAGEGFEGLTRVAEEVAEQTTLLAQNAPFQIFSLVFLGLYCLVIYNFRGQLAAALKSVVTGPSKYRIDPHPEQKRIYDRFVVCALLAGAAALGIAAVKALAAGIIRPERLAAGIAAVESGAAGVVRELPALLAGHPWWSIGAVLAVGVVALCLFAIQGWVLRVAGKLVLESEFTDLVAHVKKTDLAVWAVIALPPVLMFSGLNPAADAWFVYIIIAETIILGAIFAVQTMRLFVRQKLSLLVWFLYLCGVEIFPVSLVVLVMVKNV